ncbi:hypothetical protein [Candidatus Synchoanobacter obligatus]|uniref:Uncharacterized protein n=1 Tax=Candidatus Synchoanobacter obligatus TaxID=2919597 RepID=A0ABT1L3W5_9GAMM|nr:hypothetical protein [Candidatus Synchoanobacter obligatus]MCP8351884.1 hypothetical protein [Candidatus Synchoanobacter obligatus]
MNTTLIWNQTQQFFYHAIRALQVYAFQLTQILVATPWPTYALASAGLLVAFAIYRYGFASNTKTVEKTVKSQSGWFGNLFTSTQTMIQNALGPMRTTLTSNSTVLNALAVRADSAETERNTLNDKMTALTESAESFEDRIARLETIIEQQKTERYMIQSEFILNNPGPFTWSKGFEKIELAPSSQPQITEQMMTQYFTTLNSSQTVVGPEYIFANEAAFPSLNTSANQRSQIDASTLEDFYRHLEDCQELVENKLSDLGSLDAASVKTGIRSINYATTNATDYAIKSSAEYSSIDQDGIAYTNEQSLKSLITWFHRDAGDKASAQAFLNYTDRLVNAPLASLDIIPGKENIARLLTCAMQAATTTETVELLHELAGYILCLGKACLVELNQQTEEYRTFGSIAEYVTNEDAPIQKDGDNNEFYPLQKAYSENATNDFASMLERLSQGDNAYIPTPPRGL